jgi:hypothetical protein
MPLILTADESPGTASWSSSNVTHVVVGNELAGVSGPIGAGVPFTVSTGGLAGVLPGDTVQATIAIDDPQVSVVSIIEAVVIAPGTVQLNTTGGIAGLASFSITVFRIL